MTPSDTALLEGAQITKLKAENTALRRPRREPKGRPGPPQGGPPHCAGPTLPPRRAGCGAVERAGGGVERRGAGAAGGE